MLPPLPRASVLAGALAALVLGAPGCRGRPPNVVLMSVDSLRADHLGCYGYAQRTSPAIDALAREGVRFETAISTTSWTLPAHAALLTGLPDPVHGVADDGRRLADGYTTLAELFRRAGYRTGGFVSGPYLHPAFGFAQGFDAYGYCGSAIEPTGWSTAPRDRRQVWAWNESAHADVTSPKVLERALAFLDGAGSAPFFLFLHWWDPHYDYEPPAPYDTRFDPGYAGRIRGANVETDPEIDARLPESDRRHLEALYDGEIAWTDHHIGLLLDQLRKRGLWGDTIVVLTADHGEEFFEHGGKTHQKTLFDEVIRVPLVIRWPRGPKGRVVGGQVRLVDVAPTLLDLCRLPRPPEMALGLSQSLKPFLSATGQTPDLPAYSQLTVAARDLDVACLRGQGRDGAWKACWNFRGDRYWFDDLARDPAEQHTANDDPRAGPALRALLDRRGALARLGAQLDRAGTERVDTPDQIREQLRSLGYLGGAAPPAPQPRPKTP